VAAFLELIWAFIGLLLTIGGTFVEVSMTAPPWNWSQEGVLVHPLRVTCQVGAVLLVGCMGGKNAGALSQIAYITLGLTWLPVFTFGGGLDYVFEPSFGYILGFVPGAWVCGALALRNKPRLELLALSCLSGLITIHLVGLTYLALISSFNQELIVAGMWKYSLNPLPGQLVLVCAVTAIAKFLRTLMCY